MIYHSFCIKVCHTQTQNAGQWVYLQSFKKDKNIYSLYAQYPSRQSKQSLDSITKQTFLSNLHSQILLEENKGSLLISRWGAGQSIATDVLGQKVGTKRIPRLKGAVTTQTDRQREETENQGGEREKLAGVPGGVKPKEKKSFHTQQVNWGPPSDMISQRNPMQLEDMIGH